MAATKSKSTKSKSKKAEEVEEDDEEEDLELEDLDEDVEDDGDDKPAKQEVEFGASDLAAHLSEKTGKKITPRELRALIRKMAREDDPRVDREITPGNRTRYNWPGGLKNPEVKRIIKAVTSGEMEADKKAKLEELKANKAKKDAAKGKKGKGKSKKAKDPEPEEVDDDEIEEIELDDEDE